MKKISDAIMVSIVSGAEIRRNIETMAMLGGNSLDPSLDPASRRFF